MLDPRQIHSGLDKRMVMTSVAIPYLTAVFIYYFSLALQGPIALKPKYQQNTIFFLTCLRIPVG